MTTILVPAPVQALIDAINAADTDAFVASFAPDAKINDQGRMLSGSSAVRSWAESEATGVGARMRLVEAGTTDGLTHVVFDWSSLHAKGRCEAFITVRDGHVVEFRIPPQ